MFDQLVAIIAQLGNMLRPWAFDIATAMVVCLILVFSADVNRLLRRHLSVSYTHLTLPTKRIV